MGDQSKNDDGGAAQSVVNDGGPAFPHGTKHEVYDSHADETPDEVHEFHGGMSLRDWFAGRALQGIVAGDHAGEGGGLWPDSPNPMHKGTNVTCAEMRAKALKQTAADAYAYADAMIAARGPVPPLPEQSDLQGLRRKVKSLSKALEAIAYAPVGAATASDREVLAGVVKLARTALEGGGA